MKARLLLFLFLFISGKSFAQETTLPVFEIRSDSSMAAIDDRYWEMLEDPGKDLEFPSVRNQQGFHDRSLLWDTRGSIALGFFSLIMDTVPASKS